MPSSTSVVLKSPTWDGDAAHFAAFRRQLRLWCIKMNVSWVLFAAETKIAAPDDAALQQKGNILVYAALEESIDDATATIIGLHDLDLDSANIWQAFEQHAAGQDDASVGPNLLQDFLKFAFPTDGSHEAQITAAIVTLKAILDRSGALAEESKYKISEEQLVYSLISKLPESFNAYHHTYKEKTTFATLLPILRADAQRFDDTPQAHGHNIVLVAPQSHGTYERSARNMDKEAGPPSDHKTRWCEHHGWCNHETPTCSQETGKPKPGSGGIKQKGRTDRTKDVCRACGQTGHWIRECPEVAPKDANELALTVLITKYSGGDDDTVQCRLGRDGQYHKLF